MNINAPTTSEAANKMGKKTAEKEAEMGILRWEYSFEL